MSSAVIARVVPLVCLIASLGNPVAGQSTQTKPATKKPPVSAAAEKKAPEKKASDKTPASPKAAPAAQDLKIRTKYTSFAQLSENTTYVKGARQRVEFPGAVTIAQPDLGRTLLVNPASKTYFVAKDGEAPGAAAAAAAAPPPVDAGQPGTAGQKTPAKPAGGVVTYTTTLTDTGERKQMFGREARRVTTVITREPSASACDKTRMTVEVDGWYVDVAGVTQGVNGAAPARSAAPVPKPDGCVDQVETRTKGDAKLGFPVATTTTTKTGEGDKQEATTSSMEVTTLDTTPLDAALFDVPAGYTEVRTSGELMSGFQAAGGLSEALLGSTANGTSTAAPKGAGAIRVGVLEPIDNSTHNLPTRELRQELAANFQQAPFEALTLSGSSVAQSQAEAGRMECDYLLYSEIADIKTSKPGKVGGLLKKVTGDGPARDVHEVKLEYKLYRVGAAAATAPVFADSAKASSGGGFDIRSALRVAMFAGSLYLRFTGLGLLSPTLLANFGGGLGPLAGTGLFDPRMNAMASMTQLVRGGGLAGLAGGDGSAALPNGAPGPDPQIEIRQTVDTALANAAKGAIEQLRKGKK
jgi:hypothetical protein